MFSGGLFFVQGANIEALTQKKSRRLGTSKLRGFMMMIHDDDGAVQCYIPTKKW